MVEFATILLVPSLPALFPLGYSSCFRLMNLKMKNIGVLERE